MTDETDESLVPEGSAESHAEGSAEGEIGSYFSDDLRARVWRLYLRGHTYKAIGLEVGLDRETVSRMVRQLYSELGHDRREALESALEEEIARLRHIQTQAWADHDTDDERERAVLALALGEPVRGAENGAKKAAKKGGRRRSPPDREAAGAVRFTSQRAAYLRVALDCEKEVMRLRGLYGPALPLEEGAQIVFRIERVESSQADLTPRPPLPLGEREAQVAGLLGPGVGEEEG